MTAYFEAPSFEERSPQRGAILEQHSLTEDQNGMLLEFQDDVDEESGMYKTTKLNCSICKIEILPSFCRRPELKPLEFRERLVQSASDIMIGLNHSEITRDEATKKIHSLVKEDPCFALGYCLLATNCEDSDTTTEEYARAHPVENEKKIQLLYRCVANIHAYKGFVRDDIFQYSLSLLVKRLYWADRFDEAIEVQGSDAVRYDLMLSSDVRANVIYFFWQYTSATSLLHYSMKLRRAGNMAKRFEMLERSGLQFITCVGIGVGNPAVVAELPSSNRIINGCIDQILYCLKLFNKERLRLSNIQSTIGVGEDIHDSNDRELWICCRRIQQIVEGLLEACTVEDGEVMYLTDDQHEEFYEYRNVATETIRPMGWGEEQSSSSDDRGDVTSDTCSETASENSWYGSDGEDGYSCDSVR